MKVELLPADHGACGFYRMRAPAACIDGATVSDEGLSIARVGGRVVDAIADADVVVLQRPGPLAEAIPFLQRRGIAVVVDMDDDFSCIDPASSARIAGAQHPLILEACRLADLVTVTTPKLAQRYGGHGRVEIIPNYVPAAYLTIPHGGDGATVGWAGSVGTHPNDLQVTGGALADFPFHVIGDGEGVQRNLRLTAPPTVSGIVRLEDYPFHVGTLDVGIVPLHPSPFNEAKSALKMLEYASLGVAPVVSPTPDNIRLYQAGIGVLARRPRDWRRAVTDLLGDDTYRTDVAARSREIAREHTVERNAWRWERAWARALSRRRARSLQPA